MKKLFFITILTALCGLSAFAQLSLPRASQRQEVSQTVGDTRISIVYHRPNVNKRVMWGCQAKNVVPKANYEEPCLVPNGQVWRVGANENTTFEVTNDVKINGQTLPAGKYGLHMIPGDGEWTVIFNKVNNEWGSFKYDEKQDQLRIRVKPQTLTEIQETMSLAFENVKPTATDVAVRWEKIRVPFTVDIGDMNPRVLVYIREQLKNVKADDYSSQVAGARYVYDNKMTANYDEAVTWIDAFLKKRQTLGALALKANILADTGKTAEAIATAEKALEVAATMNPKPNTAPLEKKLAEWKAKK